MKQARGNSVIVARLTLLSCLVGWAASAASTWNGPAGGDLDAAGNWSPAGVPGDNATANFSNNALDTSALTMTAIGNLGGGVGCTFSVTQTNPLTITVNGGSCRLAGITLAAGAGALTFANGAGNGIVLSGGNANVMLPFVNHSTNPVTFGSNVRPVPGGGSTYTKTIAFNGPGDWIFNGPLGGASGAHLAITKSGSGTVTLAGVASNSFDGPIIISNGTLRITSSYAATNNSVITVLSGATLDVACLAGGWHLVSGETLAGNGTNKGAVIIDAGATVSAGLGGSDTSPMNFTSALTLNGTTLLTINRTNAPNASRIVGATTLTYGGALKVLNAGPDLLAGDSFTLFSASAYSGGFSNMLLPALGYGLAWSNRLAIDRSLLVVATTNFPHSTITLTPGTTFQTVYGIGGNVCQGDQKLLDAYNRYDELFSPSGLNLSFIRLSTSFELTNSRFAGYDDANLAATAEFRARQPDGRITLTAWSPPENLKSTASAYGGTLAKVDGQYVYTNYANWWLRTLRFYETNGALPDYVSIQNEPDFTPSGTNFAYEAGNYLGATETATKAGYPQAIAAVKSALASNGLGAVKVIGPDTTAIAGGKIPNYVTNCAPGSFFGLAHHLYHDSPATTGTAQLSQLDTQYSFATWPKFMTELNPFDQFESAVFATQPDWMQLAVTMHNTFVYERANTYLVWNVMYGTINYGNGQPADTKTYHPLGHYSKFVRPGAVRALTSTSDANLKVTLFRHTNSPGISDRYVVVMINTGGNYSYPTLNTSNLWSPDGLQRSWQVFKTADDGSTQFRLTLDDSASGAALTNQNQSLVLPPYSITTAIINNGLASTPTNITHSVTNNQLRLSWPTSHRGWILQTQMNTRATGLATNWSDIAGSENWTQATLALNPASGAGFYRLRHP
jgi:autotransporter-associated beta strand protein